MKWNVHVYLKSPWLKGVLCGLLFVVVIMSTGCAGATSASSGQTTSSMYHAETLWDTWGVPHIFAPDNKGLFYAFGQAQMQNHADLLLTLYGEARGRAAEYWGANYLTSDETIRAMGFPARAQQWYNAQTPEFRQYIDAFVAGINDFATRHPDQISPQFRVVLPVRATDVFAHIERVLGDFLIGKCSSVLESSISQGPAPNQRNTTPGSNGWAIGPAHSASGDAMLLANPHLPWSGEYTFFEAQLHSPTVDTYGSALVGFPVLQIAFNNFLSWTHTVNPTDACDIYMLTPSPDGKGYLYDGQTRSFDTQKQTILVKQPDGSLQSQQFVTRRSIQGPAFIMGNDPKNGGMAIRIAGVDQFPDYGVLQEWWDMGLAKNLQEFQGALQKLQIPMFNVIYADRDGHIMYLFNGDIPKHPSGDWNHWAQPVPGDTSTTLWTSLLPYSSLPKVIDPPTGWVQNGNDPPWYTTIPQTLDPQQYPPDLTSQPTMRLREQYGVQMLTNQSKLSFDQVVADKFSSHVEMADRVLNDLIAAAHTYGNSLDIQAADVLQKWDRTTDATSKGSALFYEWYMTTQQNNRTSIFAVPWNAAQPLTTPSGLANPQAAVSALDQAAHVVLADAGSLDVAWGDVFRLQRGKVDVPASGGPSDPMGIFRDLTFSSGRGGKFAANGGDSYIAVVEFAKTVHARVLVTYGNASQPNSPHNGDQLTLYAHNQMRDAWLSRQDIEAHLATRVVV